MGVANLARAGLTGKSCDQRRVALGQLVEDGEDVVEFLEAMHALGAAAELARGLGSAEKEHAEDSGFAARKVEDFLKAVLVFGDAAVVHGGDELVILEAVQGAGGLSFSSSCITGSRLFF